LIWQTWKPRNALFPALGQSNFVCAVGSSGGVLETGDHPALLTDAVTTPAGCTIDAIMELEEGKLPVARNNQGLGDTDPAS
jgi:hypothetical protein